ncbi:phosphoenolpyruvate carboxylase [Methanococcoides sp. FTZ1]|uniref:phosphoenolpyruvate carboxylase n=1 Tax=Methanococcoides sp. FTZ1 TaxID=3439061 RepID=UPI003F835379
MRRKEIFPKIMCTQHPDSVSRYIATQEEVEEALEAALKYGCDEYMPDYEGKATPYHQNVQIVSKFIEETDLLPGDNFHITPRVPSATQENRFRQIMVMMSIAEANYTSHQFSSTQAITELVHPMTSTTEEIIESQKHMIEVGELARKEFHFEMDTPRVIPLIEDVQGLINAEKTIGNTISSTEKILGQEIDRYRVFIGKSDSALSFGHVASALSCKYAINDLCELEKKIDTSIGIIFGAGTLPFRGHLNRQNATNFFEEYKGISTITLQSAIRFNHSKAEYEELIRYAREKLSGSPEKYDPNDKNDLVNMIAILGSKYNRIIHHIAPTINRVSTMMPQQRDRLIHGSSTGYSREVAEISSITSLCRKDLAEELGKSIPSETVSFPRAIKFTGALYSIGLPPEVIGLGNALEDIRKKIGEEAFENLISKYLPSMASDISFAFGYLDLRSAARFLPPFAQRSLQKDVDVLKDIFSIEQDCDPSYRKLLEIMQPELIRYDENPDENVSHIMESTLLQMAKIRRALG